MPEPPYFNVDWQSYVDQQFKAHEHAMEMGLSRVNEGLIKTEELQIERVESVRRETQLALDAANIAIGKYEAAAERRFTSVDELRRALADIGEKTVSREVHESQYAQIKASVDGLEILKANERLQIERVEALRREARSLQESNVTAITKSEVASEKRFEGVNEFRAQLQDQANRFIPREVVDQQTVEFRSQIAGLSSRLDTMGGGTAAGQRLTALAIGGLGLFITLIVFLANYVFAQ